MRLAGVPSRLARILAELRVKTSIHSSRGGAEHARWEHALESPGTLTRTERLVTLAGFSLSTVNLNALKREPQMKTTKLGTLALLLSSAALLSATASADCEVSQKPQCQKGKIQCVHHVAQAMNKRFKKLTKECDHDAIFSLAYLRTTETYGETAEGIGYEDVASVTREDALFADYYFRAYDAYHSGDGEVPPAWQIAFDAAESKSVTSSGNAILGFNAHIQRDLPFTLYELYEQGTPVSEFDHFKVNEFLAQVDVVDEIIERFDPTYPTGGDSSFIYEWRALAWYNYTLLRDAQSQQEWDAVAASIEQYTGAVAAQYAYFLAYPEGTSSEERDAYCEANN